MSTNLAVILDKVEELSFDELLTVQEKIVHQMRTKQAIINSPLPATLPNQRFVLIPGAHQPTQAEIDAELAEVFTSEELADLDNIDFSNLPPGKKTITEMLAEDREDRF